MQERRTGGEPGDERDTLVLRWQATIERDAQEELAAADTALEDLIRERVASAGISDATGVGKVGYAAYGELESHLELARFDGRVGEVRLEEAVITANHKDPALARAVGSTGRLLIKIQSLQGAGDLRDITIGFINTYPIARMSKASETVSRTLPKQGK